MSAPDLLTGFATWLAMGGYGLYVWGSMGMCVAVVIAEVLSLRTRRRALLQELATSDTPAPPVRQPVLTRQEAT
jgi:heme exporter protein D